MPRLLGNTLTLVLGVGIGVTCWASLAWLTSLCEFPGRRWLDWALMLPFAIPAYVLAFVFVGLLDFAGPVQTLLREWFGSGMRLPRVRSTGGVILVLVLVFYPYVYLLARTAFLAQGKGLMEAARVLGQSPWQAFWRVALPMARPAIGAGVALALMETLADFGAVSVFNFDTFTTAIYKTWYGFFSLSSAAQLASLLLLVVMLVLYGERRARRQPGEQRTATGQGAVSPARFQGAAGHGWCGLVFACAFVIPCCNCWCGSGSAGASIWMSVRRADRAHPVPGRHGSADHRQRRAAAGLRPAPGADPGDPCRGQSGQPGLCLARLGAGGVDHAGVQLPGPRTGDSAVRWLGGAGKPLLLGSLSALLLAYLVRFIAVAYGPLENSLARIRPSLPEAARSLGVSGPRLFFKVYLPLLLPGTLSAALLVFVDVLKEMPATLLMRPFGWDTLAVRIFEMTSEGEWARASLPALTLVLVGLLPVIGLIRRSAHRNS
jgi:iron(III) transport system permease protein